MKQLYQFSKEERSDSSLCAGEEPEKTLVKQQNHCWWVYIESESYAFQTTVAALIQI